MIQTRAAILRAHGGPPRVEDLPEPKAPGQHELVVRMLRAPINPADRLIIAGNYAAAPPLPATLGAEGVGVVTAIGTNVRNVRVGDHVLPLTRGNWATHRLLKERDVIRVSQNLPIEQAAMLRINPATAWRMLQLAPLQSGDWIIQNGATSAVAALVRTFAQQRCINVVNIVRAGSGARVDGIVVEDGPNLASHVSKATNDAPIVLALDCVAGPANGALAACLAPGSQIIVFGHLSGQPSTIPSTLLTGKQLIVRGFSLRPAEAADDHAALQALYDQLAANLRDPATYTPAARTFPLGDLQDALHASEQRGAGRILLALDA